MFPQVKFLEPYARTRGAPFSAVKAEEFCRLLESGGILVLPETPLLRESDLSFLAAARQVKSKFHKNISYRPLKHRLTGFDRKSSEGARMVALMREYSQAATQFMGELLQPYSEHWRLDLASFRPIAEQSRSQATRSRNDLLHIDAFPTRPTNGARILRVFTNTNSEEPRVWTTTVSFGEIAQRFAGEAGLGKIADSSSGRRNMLRLAAPLFRIVNSGFADRSPYDRFMLGLHDLLKRDANFQRETPKLRIEFPPRSTWIAFTDMVAHAVESGQFALEHTFLVPFNAMLARDKAPLALLENLCGKLLTN
jgi:hypothetical protein